MYLVQSRGSHQTRQFRIERIEHIIQDMFSHRHVRGISKGTPNVTKGTREESPTRRGSIIDTVQPKHDCSPELLHVRMDSKKW